MSIAMDGYLNNNDSNSSGGGGGCCSQFLSEQEEPASLPTDYGAGHSLAFLAGTTVPESKPNLTTTASSSPKRSRRSVQKRVVSVPFAEADGSRSKGCGEGAPPSDSWAWRKYGQKPIKGSPYPRGYYRCSSSKGCPARKQVERSSVDPTMLVVTYACEHNHPWPLPKNHHHHSSSTSSPPKPQPHREPEAPAPAPVLPGPPLTSSLAPASTATVEADEIFAADICGDESSLMMMTDEFGWFSDVSTSPPATEALLDSPIYGGIVADDVDMLFPVIGDDDNMFGGEGGEEESLFAGLGELPEWSVVFRRGFLERQMQMQGQVSRRCGLTATP